MCLPVTKKLTLDTHTELVLGIKAFLGIKTMNIKDLFYKYFMNGELFTGAGMFAGLFLLMDYLGFNEKVLQFKLTGLELAWIGVIACPVFTIGVKMMMLHADKTITSADEKLNANSRMALTGCLM